MVRGGGYIQANHPKLYKELNVAKEYMKSDPQSSLFKIRFVVEKLLDDILLAYSVYSSPTASFYEKTSLVEEHIKGTEYSTEEERLHKRLLEGLNCIRVKGNGAVHEDSQIKKDIELCLVYMNEIDTWLSVYSLSENEAKNKLFTSLMDDFSTENTLVQPTIEELKEMKIKEWAKDKIGELERPESYISQYDVQMKIETKEIYKDYTLIGYCLEVSVLDAISDTFKMIEELSMRECTFKQGSSYSEALKSYFSSVISVDVWSPDPPPLRVRRSMGRQAPL